MSQPNGHQKNPLASPRAECAPAGEVLISGSHLTATQQVFPDKEDKTERKRVLNVLAQRRYRQRQKQKLSQATKILRTNSQAAVSDQLGHGNETPPGSVSDSGGVNSSLVSSSSTATQCTTGGNGVDQGNIDWHDTGIVEPLVFSASDLILPDDVDLVPTAHYYLGEGQVPCSLQSWPSLQPEDTTQILDDTSMGSTGDIEYSSSSSSPSISDWLQEDDSASSTFTDDRSLTVPTLDLLRAAHTIATHLRCVDRLFDLTANSIFCGPQATDYAWISSLPRNLRPTPAQLSIPHHPLLDLLPWPSMRTKLICMFAMPEESLPRHPKDREPLDFTRFVHDTDEGLGLTVSGVDPTSESCWEVMPEFAETWWWALNREILGSSNRRRTARGLPMLKFGMSGATGG